MRERPSSVAADWSLISTDSGARALYVYAHILPHPYVTGKFNFLEIKTVKVSCVKGFFLPSLYSKARL